jgi:hypothetical protein
LGVPENRKRRKKEKENENGGDGRDQGCQIFLRTMYQNGKEIHQATTRYSKGPNKLKVCMNNIPNSKYMYKYTKVFHSKTSQNIPKF